MDSRYQATAAPVLLPPRALGSAWWGVLVGLLTEWGANLALTVAVLVVMLQDVLGTDLRGLDAIHEVGRRLVELSPHSLLYWFIYLTELMFSMLGGYVGARVVRRTHCWPGLIHAVISAVLTILVASVRFEPDVMTAIDGAAVFVPILLGAWMGRERTVR